MKRPLVLAAAFVAVVFSGVGFAADDAAPDWSKYNKVSTVVKGVVVKADDGSITVEVPDVVKKGAKFDPNTGKETSKAGVKPGKKDVTYTYASEGLVRWLKMPVKKDDSGKVIPATQKELDDARKPAGVNGYWADKGDLKAGHQVEVHFVTPKDTKNPTESDYLVKYVFIEGETKAPTPTKKK